jgi:hypothetical protein
MAPSGVAKATFGVRKFFVIWFSPPALVPIRTTSLRFVRLIEPCGDPDTRQGDGREQ